MNFKSQREKSGMTQQQAAIKFGVDRTTITKWETGKSLPRAELLPKIAKVYGCEIGQLLGEAPAAV